VRDRAGFRAAEVPSWAKLKIPVVSKLVGNCMSDSNLSSFIWPVGDPLRGSDKPSGDGKVTLAFVRGPNDGWEGQPA